MHDTRSDLRRPDPWWARRAAASVTRTIRAGAERYERKRHLPRILPIGPDEIAEESIAGRRAILARLARALRAERNRGRAGHWTYDLNRHIALSQAYAAEKRFLAGARRDAAGHDEAAGPGPAA